MKDKKKIEEHLDSKIGYCVKFVPIYDENGIQNNQNEYECVLTISEESKAMINKLLEDSVKNNDDETANACKQILQEKPIIYNKQKIEEAIIKEKEKEEEENCKEKIAEDEEQDDMAETVKNKINNLYLQFEELKKTENIIYDIDVEKMQESLNSIKKSIEEDNVDNNLKKSEINSTKQEDNLQQEKIHIKEETNKQYEISKQDQNENSNKQLGMSEEEKEKMVVNYFEYMKHYAESQQIKKAMEEFNIRQNQLLEKQAAQQQLVSVENQNWLVKLFNKIRRLFWFKGKLASEKN